MDETPRKTEEDLGLHIRKIDKVRLSTRDPHFAKGMESAGKAIRRYRNALADLAK